MPTRDPTTGRFLPGGPPGPGRPRSIPRSLPPLAIGLALAELENTISISNLSDTTKALLLCELRRINRACEELTALTRTSVERPVAAEQATPSPPVNG